ncbi:MAG: 1-acyl-sn-glycerol-3-phosphate acyltransferase [Anaerolineales bacterium]|nr:1-acyl-sn-glycerol-3-phosphate acyltransferase [Anaerolineales bacterium]
MHYFLLRFIIETFAHFLKWLFLDLTVEGWDNLPPYGPLLVIGNHFSWFEAPLIILLFPRRVRFVVMAELGKLWFFRPVFYAYGMIPIARGQVDRAGLREAEAALAQGEVVGIMPEGGIDPDVQAQVQAGETATGGEMSRRSGQLIAARPGAALLAVRSGVPIVPVAFVGTEKVMGNVRRGRKTAVSFHIGLPFGPLTLPQDLRGADRRHQLDELGHQMMRCIAALLPPENRGPYG